MAVSGSSCSYQGNDYRVGDSVFLMPDAFAFNIRPKMVPSKKYAKKEVVSARTPPGLQEVEY